jgi:radical SAM-linked protein
MNGFMASDSPALATPAAGASLRDKVRVRFTKGSAVRLLSHHDLMRVFERMLRRAELPLHRSQGFNPRPRMVFALSLPLGVVGREEVLELELRQELPVAEIQDRLTRQAPSGLEILSVCRIDPKASAQVRSLSYAVEVPPERVSVLTERIAAVLAAAECPWDRTRQPKRRIDLRPWIRDLRLNPPDNARPSTLEMDLWLTAAGTARPEEVLGLLGLADLTDAGAVLTRSRLELHDESPPP